MADSLCLLAPFEVENCQSDKSGILWKVNVTLVIGSKGNNAQISQKAYMHWSIEVVNLALVNEVG